VVKKTVIFVVVEDEGSFRPDVWIGSNGIDLSSNEICTVGRKMMRMFRCRVGWA
jgi:hypothetical protein